MGSFCGLGVGHFSLFTTKSHVYAPLMMIFRETDNYSTNNIIDDGFGEEMEEKTFGYKSSAHIIKRRLEIMGYSLKGAKQQFERKIQYLTEWDFEDGRNELHKTFDEFLGKIAEKYYESKGILEDRKGDILNRYSITKEYEEYIENSVAYVQDARELLYCLLSVIKEDISVDYDLSQTHEEGDTICETAIHELLDDFHINEKVLIITEGKTDIEFLKPAFQQLFPEYCEYYSFLDFDLGNIGGSVSSIEKIVQGFIGSGIRNRIIVLFDNDTAGRHGIVNLKKIKVPKNIKILQYPNIEIANTYPTMGPGGLEMLNINGLAGSIEIYLGRDILSIKKGELEPIQWTGYDEKFKQYQGSLLNKIEVQERFRKKLLSTYKLDKLKNPELVEIFEVILKAFI